MGRAPWPARVPPDPLPIPSEQPIPNLTSPNTRVRALPIPRCLCSSPAKYRLRDARRRGSGCRPFLKPVSGQIRPHPPSTPPNLTEPLHLTTPPSPPAAHPEAPQSHIDPNLIPVLETIAHRLSRTAHLPAHALHRVRLNARRERSPGKPHHPHRRPRHNRPMRLPIESIRISCGCCVARYGTEERRAGIARHSLRLHRDTMVLSDCRVSQNVASEPARCARLTF